MFISMNGYYTIESNRLVRSVTPPQLYKFVLYCILVIPIRNEMPLSLDLSVKRYLLILLFVYRIQMYGGFLYWFLVFCCFFVVFLVFWSFFAFCFCFVFCFLFLFVCFFNYKQNIVLLLLNIYLACNGIIYFLKIQLQLYIN